MRHPFLLLLLPLLCPLALTAKDEKPAKKKAVTKEKPDANAMAFADQYHWADWVEPDFPFFSSVLDARDAGKGFPKNNLTPRGLILNLGHNLWACFDTDLLRIACIWQGEEGKPPVTPAALAPGSYHIAGQKTKDGEDDLPKPVGKALLSNGLCPGWQVLKSLDEKPAFVDPREPAPDKEEIGKGPLDDKLGRFVSLQYTKSTKDDALDGPSVTLELEVAGVAIREVFGRLRKLGSVFASGPPSEVVVRISVAPTDKILALAAGYVGPDLDGVLTPAGSSQSKIRDVFLSPSKHGEKFLVIPSHSEPVEFEFGFISWNPQSVANDTVPVAEAPKPRWPQTITTKATLSQKDDAYVVDDIPLPLDNPWKRNVRLADLAFLDDKGHAAAVTLDGDVWLISGLNGDLTEVKWKRFASGLHEPMSIVARKDEGGRMKDEKASKSEASENSLHPSSLILPPSTSIYVFDRNGIWRLRGTKGTGEADVYEMFCNRFAQTAETREFPNSMKLAPDGSFIISKGGQQGTYLGKHNGTVIRVSPDGKKFDVIGYGLRQPFIGVNPKTGTVFASDQEGNYVPTTPIHIIKDHQFYGHLATIQPHEQYPQTIAEPLTWIPHAVCASGMTLTWLAGAKMGDINDEMILVSYNKPEIFRVLENNRASRPQAAVVPWTRNLDFPTLNAHVNPADGQLYAIGFQIWGTTVKRISGLARIRYTGKPRVLLTECTPCDKGVLLKFNLPLDKTAATNPDNFNVERWNYKRTFNYGSGHFKADGTSGQEWMVPSSAYLSKDGKSVFIGLPDMKTNYMQMRLGYGLKSAEGLPAQNNAYFTPYELVKFDPAKEGFENIAVDLTPRKMVIAAAVKPTVEEGKRLYEMMGCMACHSIDGTVYGKVGPSWKGLYGSERILAKGGDRVTADDAYIKESIQDPGAKIVKGYEKLDAGMPIYNGVLNDSQIASITLFIKSLK